MFLDDYERTVHERRRKAMSYLVVCDKLACVAGGGLDRPGALDGGVRMLWPSEARMLAQRECRARRGGVSSGGRRWSGTPHRHPKGALTHIRNGPGCKIFLGLNK